MRATPGQPTAVFRAVPRGPVTAPPDVPGKAVYDGKETFATLKLIP